MYSAFGAVVFGAIFHLCTYFLLYVFKLPDFRGLGNAPLPEWFGGIHVSLLPRVRILRKTFIFNEDVMNGVPIFHRAPF